MTTNKFDFLEGICSPEHIINLLIDKKGIENQIYEASKELSALHSKNITISFYFERLYAVFKNIFLNLNKSEVDRHEKIICYEKVIPLILFFAHIIFLNRYLPL